MGAIYLIIFRMPGTLECVCVDVFYFQLFLTASILITTKEKQFIDVLFFEIKILDNAFLWILIGVQNQYKLLNEKNIKHIDSLCIILFVHIKLCTVATIKNKYLSKLNGNEKWLAILKMKWRLQELCKSKQPHLSH